MNWFFIALILGAVEGLTEFLPVSSTGHLIILGHILGFTGDSASVFEVAIQLGAIFAVAVLYRQQFISLFFPLFPVNFDEKTTQKSQESKTIAPITVRFGAAFNPMHGLHGARGLLLLALTTLPPSVAGLMLHSRIKPLFTPLSVAAALAVGAVLMICAEHIANRRKKAPKPQTTICSLDEMTLKNAFLIGCFQCLALWPGFSRSAATIMGGMLLGAQRSTAAEYSFIAAVPLMIAATGYDIWKHLDLFAATDMPLFAAGMLFSFIFAWLAVKGFIALTGRLTLRPFAWYRLILAPTVYVFLCD